MITGALIGFLAWLLLVVLTLFYIRWQVGSWSGWNFTPNYGGMLIVMLIGAAINYFLF